MLNFFPDSKGATNVPSCLSVDAYDRHVTSDATTFIYITLYYLSFNNLNSLMCDRARKEKMVNLFDN